MRTTLTLDPDVAERLRKETRGGRVALKKVINDSLRRGLGIETKGPRKRFKVKPQRSGFRAGIDPVRLGALLDDLEAEEATRQLNRTNR